MSPPAPQKAHRRRWPFLAGWRIYASARGFATLVTAWLSALVLVVVPVWAVVRPGWLSVDVIVWDVAWRWDREPRWVRSWEAGPVVLGVVAAVAIVPRLASWERLVRRRLRPYAAAAATLALVAPASVAAAASAVLPEDAPRAAVVTNVTSLAAIALALVAVLGPFAGALSGLMIYPALIALQHALPDVASQLPFAGVGRAWDANWVASILLATGAIGVWFWTCGRSRLAWFLTPER